MNEVTKVRSHEGVNSSQSIVYQMHHIQYHDDIGTWYRATHTELFHICNQTM